MIKLRISGNRQSKRYNYRSIHVDLTSCRHQPDLLYEFESDLWIGALKLGAGGCKGCNTDEALRTRPSKLLASLGVQQSPQYLELPVSTQPIAISEVFSRSQTWLACLSYSAELWLSSKCCRTPYALAVAVGCCLETLVVSLFSFFNTISVFEISCAFFQSSPVIPVFASSPSSSSIH